MKKLIFIGLLLCASIAHAEFYRVEVMKIDSNLFRTREGVIIETRYCFGGYRSSYTNAVLRYDYYSYDNKLFFEDGEDCDVKRIF